jgi:Ca2+-binding EF-hand superfamily protein
MRIYLATFLLLSFSISQAEEWVEPIKMDSASTCVNPMIKIEKLFQIDRGGLQGVVDNMKQIDLNKDGRVCLDEVQEVAPKQIPTLGRIDYNNDRCISVKEMKRAIELRVKAAWEVQFTFMDGNKDKAITLNPNEILAEFDQDFDQKITWDEYQQRAIKITRGITR